MNFLIAIIAIIAFTATTVTADAAKDRGKAKASKPVPVVTTLVTSTGDYASGAVRATTRFVGAVVRAPFELVRR